MKQKRSLNLINVFGLKEAKFWKRTWGMHHKFNWFMKLFPIGFPLAFILISIGHICIVTISFLFETWLWITNRDQFKTNMVKMLAQVA